MMPAVARRLLRSQRRMISMRRRGRGDLRSRMVLVVSMGRGLSLGGRGSPVASLMITGRGR